MAGARAQPNPRDHCARRPSQATPPPPPSNIQKRIVKGSRGEKWAACWPMVAHQLMKRGRRWSSVLGVCAVASPCRRTDSLTCEVVRVLAQLGDKPVKLSVGLTIQAYLLEIDGLLTQ